jgi:hypothetical protein
VGVSEAGVSDQSKSSTFAPELIQAQPAACRSELSLLKAVQFQRDPWVLDLALNTPESAQSLCQRAFIPQSLEEQDRSQRSYTEFKQRSGSFHQKWQWVLQTSFSDLWIAVHLRLVTVGLMAARRQSKRSKRDGEMVKGPMGSNKRVKVELEAETSDVVEQDRLDLTLGDTSPADTKIRTTQTLRGVKNQLKTPEQKKGSRSENDSEADNKDSTDDGMAKKVPKSEKKESTGEEEANDIGEDLTDFEKERRATMARNEAMLLALGVQEAAQGFDASMHTKRAR